MLLLLSEKDCGLLVHTGACWWLKLPRYFKKCFCYCEFEWISVQNVSCINKLLLSDSDNKTRMFMLKTRMWKRLPVIHSSLRRAVNAQSIFHCSLIKCLCSYNRLQHKKLHDLVSPIPVCFPTSGINFIPSISHISAPSLFQAWLSCLGLSFYGSLLMTNCGISTKTNLSCNQSESQSDGQSQPGSAATTKETQSSI